MGQAWPKRAALLALLMVLPQLQPAMAQTQERVSGEPAARVRPQPGGVQLKIRRLPDALELMVEGTGPAPQLVQSESGNRWQGLLTTSRPTGLRLGPQRLSIPEAGLQMVSFDGAGSTYRLEVTATPGQPASRPVVSADGNNLILSFRAPSQTSLQLARPNLTLPGRLPDNSLVPALQPRAVAPPLGDMAVGTMVIRNRSYLELSGPPVTLTTRGARARDVLMTLARMGGYGFTYVEEFEIVNNQKTETKASGEGSNTSNLALDAYQSGGEYATLGGRSSSASAYAQRRESQFSRDKDIALTPSPPVSVSFVGERFDRAFNFVLLASNLQARLEGRTILVGKRVQNQAFGPQLSKVYRLNQVEPDAAADYLANLGAKVSKTNTIKTAVTQGATANQAISGGRSASTTQEQTQTEVVSYGASQGPLIGLSATTDTRLRTITLVGEPALISIAEQYIKQLDLRQRQVALSVQILDVTLTNKSEVANSFAFRYGNMFIVNANGQLLANLGTLKPPNTDTAGQPGNYTGAEGTSPQVGLGAFSGIESGFIDRPNSLTPLTGKGSTIPTRKRSLPFYGRPGLGPYSNPSQPGATEMDNGKITYKNPTQFKYPADQLFDFVRASIVSGSTKVLASPTLILQEGDSSASDAGSDATRISRDGLIGRSRSNEGFVRVGTQFITAYEVKQDVNGNNFCQPVFTNAGLTFGARVESIDDNGFVTFSLSPEISAPAGSEQRDAGTCGKITLIQDRMLDTGRVRVRDGQTLILTGVISESDRADITKWPLLGDLPIVGQFFRNSTGDRQKNELVILVTPRIINDDQGGIYGYGWQPSTRASREFMGSQP